ncbi:unnamed protein product [Moneuplotes crassus]|uniref:Uncharacterized protein n=1 Tax=Euplotes crassus TaxID=5936 RepID=A0AAD1X5J4_EUPCR|nr:unnamed protein product [Moneuplotes crassus]
MNRTEKEKQELKSAYQDRCHLKLVNLKDGKMSHFQIGGPVHPILHNQSTPADTSSNFDAFRDHKIDADTVTKQLRKIKKTSKNMRKANFAFSPNHTFYSETTHNNSLQEPDTKLFVNYVKGKQYQCNFVLGSSSNEFVSTTGQEFATSREKKSRAYSVNSREKINKFRKHNFVVGYNKLNYETSNTAKKKFPSHYQNQCSKMSQITDLKKSSFSIGNKVIDIHEGQKKALNASVDLSHKIKNLRKLSTSNTDRYRRKRNKGKSLFELMKQKNIVYGYEKSPQFSTSNKLYASSNPDDFAKQLSEQDKLLKKKSSFMFGRDVPDFHTSNKMKPVKLDTERNRKKVLHLPRPEKHNPTQYSHFKIGNDPKGGVPSSTTYKDSTQIYKSKSSGPIYSPQSPMDGMRSNLKLGNYTDTLKSETKDKYVAKRFSVDDGKKVKDIMKSINSKFLVQDLNISKINSPNHFQTTHQVFANSVANRGKKVSFEGDITHRSCVKKSDFSMNGQKTNFSIGYMDHKSHSSKAISSPQSKYKAKYKPTMIVKPAIGNFGIDNFQLAQKSLRNV